jgi:hypothetical protein
MDHDYFYLSTPYLHPIGDRSPLFCALVDVDMTPAGIGGHTDAGTIIRRRRRVPLCRHIFLFHCASLMIGVTESKIDRFI